MEAGKLQEVVRYSLVQKMRESVTDRYLLNPLTENFESDKEDNHENDTGKAHSCGILNNSSHSARNHGMVIKFSSLNWLSKPRYTMSSVTPSKNETWTEERFRKIALDYTNIREQQTLSLAKLATDGIRALSMQLFVPKQKNTDDNKQGCEDPLPEIFDDGNFVMIDGLISLLPEEVRYGRRSPNY